MTHEHEHDHEHEEELDYITVVDEEGNESLYEILFTFESEDFNKSYVIVYPAGMIYEEEVELQAYSYQENEDGTAGELQGIESEEEWDMIDEVLNTFLDDEDSPLN